MHVDRFSGYSLCRFFPLFIVAKNSVITYMHQLVSAFSTFRALNTYCEETEMIGEEFAPIPGKIDFHKETPLNEFSFKVLWWHQIQGKLRDADTKEFRKPPTKAHKLESSHDVSGHSLIIIKSGNIVLSELRDPCNFDFIKDIRNCFSIQLSWAAVMKKLNRQIEKRAKMSSEKAEHSNIEDSWIAQRYID